MADSSDPPDEAVFLSHLSALLSTSHKMSAVVEQNPALKDQLRDFDPLRSAATVAGLLTEPSLHANTIRIEYLVHVLLACAGGEREPGRREVDHWIKLAASVIALMEDPPEDVFLSNVITPNGNFRIFEGVWETSDFYLQRILNVLETLSVSDVSRLLRQEVFALLKLSEDTAARRGIARFSSGGGTEKQNVSIPSSKQLQALSNAIVYSTTDLKRLDILPVDLEPFTFPLSDRSKLVAQTLGDSDLERRPIVYDGTNWIVLLPTAISVAVRQHILTWMKKHGCEASFNRVFVAEYRKFLSQIDILGSRIPPRLSLVPRKIANKALLETLTEVDSGRYLQLIAVIDSLESFLQHGFSSQDVDVSQISEEIELRVRNARTHFRQEGSFRQGLTLVVWCGYGRPAVFGIPKESTDWWIETVSAPDIDTLSWASHSSPFSPWKLIGHHRYLSGNNVFIANANGLLNLYGWWRQTRYMMLDHHVEFGVGRQLNILIPTDCLKKIRLEVRQNLDCHVEPLPDGKMLRVIRKSWDRYLPDSRLEPSYGCIEAISAGKLLGSYVGENLIWWLAADPVKTKLPRDLVFRIWDAVGHWLERAVPILEPELALTEGALLIDLDFSDAQETQVDVASGDVLESCLSVSVEAHTRTVQIMFRDPFLGAFGHPKNIGERGILRALTQGVLVLGGRAADQINIDRYLDVIIPDEDARHLHFFKAAHFRDYIRDYDSPRGLFIDEADDARCKLGTWLVSSKPR